MKCIIFVHGNSSSSKAIEPVVNIWDRDIQIISFDLPGHGNAKRTGNYSWKTMKKFLKDKINNINGDKLILGNSAGGHFAIEIAPDISSLKGLVFFGSPPLKKPINFQEAYAPNPYTINYLKESVENEILEETLNASVENKSVISTLREDFLKTDPKVRFAMGNDLTNPDNLANEAEIFSTIKCPKYVIFGKQDITVNLKYVKQLQNESLIPYKLIAIDDCGHHPPLERPEEFKAILNEICD